MKLSQLLSIYPQLKWGDFRTNDILNLVDDSRDCGKGSVFVAIRGTKSDGHQYIKKVCQAGAIGLVVEDETQIPANFKGAVVKVENTRSALNELASRYYGEPTQHLFCVGVTGTNGKTSVTYMIEHMLTHFGWKTGVLGTINHHLQDHVWQSELTTPGALQLQKRLSEFVALGAQAAVFEVSSHAIEQKRADNVAFDTVVFTNLSRDHLDYHKDMDQYFAAKEKLFSQVIARSNKKRLRAVINIDDPYGRKIQVADSVKVLTYGQQSADYTFEIVDQSFAGSIFKIGTPHGDSEMSLKIPGRHNIYNALAATAAAMTAGASLQNCIDAMDSFTGVPGRLQRVENDKGIHVFVDYAHTPEALESVLNGLKQIGGRSHSESQIITVFGCGGDRDVGKRPLMMAAAKELSDIVFLTSDNPRTEDPLKIVNDALKVVSPGELDHNIFVEVDRAQAIARAINMANEGSLVLIAGKGHENYQIVGTEKLEFDDAVVAKRAIDGL